PPASYPTLSATSLAAQARRAGWHRDVDAAALLLALGHRFGRIDLLGRLDDGHAREGGEPALPDALDRIGGAQHHTRAVGRHEERRRDALRREIRFTQQARELRAGIGMPLAEGRRVDACPDAAAVGFIDHAATA